MRDESTGYVETGESRTTLRRFGLRGGCVQRGYQAYFAGGCVRDLLLGVAPKDFDVATIGDAGWCWQLFRGPSPWARTLAWCW